MHYIAVMETTTKQCSKCGEVKLLDGFSNSSNAKDGKMPICRTCNRARVAAWQKANPDKLKVQRQKSDPLKAKARQDKYRASDKYKDTEHRYRAKYYAEHKEELAAKSRAWWANNYAEKMPGYTAKHYAKNRCNLTAKAADFYRDNKAGVLSTKKQSRDSLDKTYLMAVIKQTSNLQIEEIPTELLELKREQLLMQRATKQLKQLLKDENHDE